ncbi:MAG: L-threonine 3-dehydrogenase [Chlamydiia bacterium]|nr:L-threonine 3-dehydrogenase [Chlamydiia bacterium]
MRGLVKREAKMGLWLEEVPVPSPGVGEVLIKIRKVALCGTDLHIYKWDDWAQRTVPVPMVVGHEFVGEIAALGEGVTDWKIGERVCGEGHLTCGKCRHCRTGNRHLCVATEGVGYDCVGCFADYFVLPTQNLFRPSPEIPDEVACLLDPLGNAVHTVRTCRVGAADVLVTGAGPIGIMGAVIAKHLGARRVVITDVSSYRLDLARKLGVEHCVNVAETDLDSYCRSVGIDAGFSVGLEMSGSPDAFNQMLEAVDHGAEIALLGLLPRWTGIDWDRVIFKMLTLHGIYGRKIFDTWYTAEALLCSGLNIDALITHRYPFEEFDRGFQAMLEGVSGRVVLDVS